MIQEDLQKHINLDEHTDSVVNSLKDAHAGLKEAIESGGDVSASFQNLMDNMVATGIDLGKRLIAAVIIYFIGRWLISLVNKMLIRRSSRDNIDHTVLSFFGSVINVVLKLLLIVAIISTLGIETSSFAALFTAAGMAIGMALSGQLSNFAAGVLILMFKPFKVGDYIDVQGQAGTVKQIQIFHTVLLTFDNKTIIIPNSVASGNTLTNYSRQPIRRVDWNLSVDYGQDFYQAKEVIKDLLDTSPIVLHDPDYAIILGQMASSSVDITVRAWCKSEDYWTLMFWFNENIYKTFNEKGIGFAYPHLVVDQKKVDNAD